MGKSENKNNIVELHPTNTPRNFEAENRFETPFIKNSKPDGSPLEIVITGKLARDIRFDALSVGKDPANYAVQGLGNWYGMGGLHHE